MLKYKWACGLGSCQGLMSKVHLSRMWKMHVNSLVYFAVMHYVAELSLDQIPHVGD